MKYEAVIFDLFGTLVDSISLEEHRRVVSQMASALSVPSDDFGRLWLDTSYKRATGVFQNKEANIEYICGILGVAGEHTRIKLAAQISTDCTKSLMNPRADAIGVISYLKLEGYKIALISNCSPEVPNIWKDTTFAPLFDVAVFSCSVGLMKPDLQIYQIATEKLAVEPQSCLYIGDGTNQELTGASQTGMHPVLIRASDEANGNPYRTNVDEWDGPVISSLSEVLDLVR